MLPKSKRLNLKTDFKRVASGKKIASKFARLFIKMGGNASPKVGIAVSGQYFKKAAERNRARRLISAAFETLYPKLPTGVDIVALPKAVVLSVKSPDVLSDLEEALKRERILGYKDITGKIT